MLLLLSAAITSELFASTLMDLRIDAALEAARRGDLEPSAELATILLKEDTSNWKGWYLRSLRVGIKALTHSEREVLESIRPPQIREVIRALMAYMDSAPEVRLPLARDVAARHPHSALALTLLASALLASGDAASAAEQADAALRVDPNHHIAARVDAAALEVLAQSHPVASRFCSLLEMFPYDSIVVGAALRYCPPSPDFSERVRRVLPVLRARRTQPLSLIALGHALAEADSIRPSKLDLESLIEALDPRDSTWWPAGRPLLDIIRQSGSSHESKHIESFLDELLLEAHTQRADVMIKHGSLALSQLLEQQGKHEQAHDVLLMASQILFPLEQGEVLEALERLDRGLDRVEQACQHGIEHDVLTHPFDVFPPARLASCYLNASLPRYVDVMAKVFPILGPHRLLDATGQPRILERTAKLPRLFIFWTSDCGWVEAEAQRIRSRSGAPGSPTQNLEILWLNRDNADNRSKALDRAKALGLNLSQVLFLPEEPGSRLDEELRVKGSPWIFLVMPTGEIVFQIPGYRTMDWDEEVQHIVRGFARFVAAP